MKRKYSLKNLLALVALIAFVCWPLSVLHREGFFTHFLEHRTWKEFGSGFYDGIGLVRFMFGSKSESSIDSLDGGIDFLLGDFLGTLFTGAFVAVCTLIFFKLLFLWLRNDRTD